MGQITYGDIKIYVENRLDLADEGFVRPAELLQYTEEAIKYCEAEVHKLGLDDCYFEAESFLKFQDGVQDYSLPSNCYGNKLLRVVWNQQGRFWDVPRIKHRSRYEDAALTDNFGSSMNYRYRLINNNPVDGVKLRLHPSPRTSDIPVVSSFTADTTAGSAELDNVSTFTGIELNMFVSGAGIRPGTRIVSFNVGANTILLNQSASATAVGASLEYIQDKVRVFYIRRAEIPTNSDDPIDFPEFWNFIAQHVVVACLKKELGNPRIQQELPYLEELRLQMIDTLTEMVPDQDNLLESDFSHYNDNGGDY